MTPLSSIRLVRHLAMTLGLLAATGAAQAELSVLINPGDQGEQSRFAVFNAWKGLLEQSLRKERVSGFSMLMSTDATADLSATRSRLHDVIVGPAHVLGSAVRYGYKPVAALDEPVQAVLVAPRSSSINDFAGTTGKRLGLPLQDSLVTYLVRGEANAANTTIKQHFGSVFESRYQDALLICLQIRRCDVVAVERSVYDRWLANGEPLKAVMESKAVPGVAIAAKPGAPVPSLDTLRASIAQGPLGSSQQALGAQLVAPRADAFDYVSTLGYFTPRVLPGAKLVDAQAVRQLIQGGALFVDARNDAEYRAGHVPGAKLIPYHEKSAKEADFNPGEDQFDLTRLPPNKQEAIVFGCNGPECWKSFKACRAAIKAGYTNVHWFRGGFPEWRSAGLRVDTGAD